MVMNYIGVDTPQIAKERVAIRVSKGGHGIEPEILEKRYYQSLEHLKQAFKICDEVSIYDNTTEMVQVMYVKENKILWQDENLPVWVNTFELAKVTE